jgi:cytochrome c biogenesis protein
MALDSLTGRRPATGSTADTAAAPQGRDIPEMLWDAITSMRLGIVLIVVMAVLAFLGTVIVQAPSAMLSDAQSKASFIASVRPRYGGWTNVLDTLGLFNVFNSIWFTGTVAVLTASLLACSANRIGGILKVARHSRVAVHERFIEHAPHHDTIAVAGDRDTLTATVVRTMKKKGYRPVVEDDGVVHVYADRFRWSPLASVAAHLSLVVILAGVIVGTAFGYRDDSFAVAEGQTKPVLSDDGLSVKLVSFTSSYYTDNGMPSDYASDVILYKDGQQIAEHVTRVNDPMRYSDPGRRTGRRSSSR